MSRFREMLEARWAEGHAVCVGLDSDLKRIPQGVRRQASNDAQAVIEFNSMIVRATAPHVCAFKPNVAFFEGWQGGAVALQETIKFIRSEAPDVPIVLDAKRGDIGDTNNGYVQMAFEYLGVDAITVNPYLGLEALDPFWECKDKGIIVLCRTSNPGAAEFQDVVDKNGDPLFLRVARHVAEHENGALVVGATYPEELEMVRQAVSDTPILIPGIGAQGGDLEAVVRVGQDSRGQGMIINSSRGVIFASGGRDFAEAAGEEVLRLSKKIKEFRQEL